MCESVCILKDCSGPSCPSVSGCRCARRTFSSRVMLPPPQFGSSLQVFPTGLVLCVQSVPVFQVMLSVCVKMHFHEVMSALCGI